MGRITATSAITWALGLSALTFGQGGFGGGAGQGGGFGGRQGGLQGPQQRELDRSVQGIEQRIAQYLNGDENKSILTPGEFCEWTLSLKAGQVVIAEARSDAFDPALEIVDGKNKVLASNDDRYPGDQRPLLLWRCEQDGPYALHARCFHDKSGGQFFSRFRIYDSLDLSSEKIVDKDLERAAPFLLRVPMAAGQIKQVVRDTSQNPGIGFRTDQVIAPNGLPNLDLAEPIRSVVDAFMAPVAGDYYVFCTPFSNGGPAKVKAGTREIVAGKLIKDGNAWSANGKASTPTLWELPVKAGDLLEVSAPELELNSRLVLANEPDVSKYDLSKAETNPFYPQQNNDPSSLFDVLPARARDNRITVLFAKRDANLWVASNGWMRNGQQFTLHVRPAASDYMEKKQNTGKLRIGNTDYWAFDAKAGDVMTFDTTATGFSQELIVRDPVLAEIRNTQAVPDQNSDHWQMTTQRPGRYFVSVSCFGNGGGGEYSLARNVFHAKEFAKGSPAQGTISTGEVQIWKFTAKPNEPLFIHWRSSNQGYGIEIYDENGSPSDFQHDFIDGQNMFGLLNVPRAQTYVIVLTGGHDRATYSIELSDIPGYKPKPKFPTRK